jgi:hypothetical protein
MASPWRRVSLIVCSILLSLIGYLVTPFVNAVAFVIPEFSPSNPETALHLDRARHAAVAETASTGLTALKAFIDRALTHLGYSNGGFGMPRFAAAI